MIKKYTSSVILHADFFFYTIMVKFSCRWANTDTQQNFTRNELVTKYES
jgi:hypothetical protein